MISDDLKTRIEQQIGQEPVVLFMKGTPQFPQCGFSAAVVGILREVGAPFASYDVLGDPELREGLKEYSRWPTYPQLYVGGKLIGGADIIRAMHANGELAPLVSSARG